MEFRQMVGGGASPAPAEARRPAPLVLDAGDKVDDGAPLALDMPLDADADLVSVVKSAVDANLGPELDDRIRQILRQELRKILTDG